MSLVAPILSLITSYIDPLLASYTSRQISLFSALIWIVLKQVLGKSLGVDWYAMIHALVTAGGALVVVYLDLNAEVIAGEGEPLRSIRCEPALTSLHSILPMVSLGYAFSDFVEGVRLWRKDWILHGLLLGSCFMLVCELGVPHLVSAPLHREVSSIPLNLLHAKWSNPVLVMGTNASFLLSFFFSRIVLVPYLWYKWLLTYYNEIIVAKGDLCYPWWFVYTVLFFGIGFHALNSYWMIFIFKKAYRKLSGIESQKEKDE